MTSGFRLPAPDDLLWYSQLRLRVKLISFSSAKCGARERLKRELLLAPSSRERLETLGVSTHAIATHLSLLLPYSISFNCCCRDCSVPTTFWIMSLFAWWNKWFLRFEVLSVDADEVPAVRCDGGDESKAFKRGAVSWWCNGRGLMDY